ncbi:hypothetical protein ACHAQJ_004800 [Trichoderma viride]
MACMRDCVHIVPAVGPQPEYENPILAHWEVSDAGYNYYYCTTHRTRHCMFADSSMDQPYCGECAPFYYQGYKNVVWFKGGDRPTLNNNDRELGLAFARDLMLVNHILHARLRGDNQQGGDPANARAPGDGARMAADLLAMPSVSDFADYGNAIPRHDITYRDLGRVLVGNPRQRGLFRLPFCDATGAVGYMPCGLDIDRRPAFAHLAQYEQFGDPIFKTARIWACKYQGCMVLPHDIRWVLWCIYMLSNEALYDCRENSEDAAWKMRGWLWYFYGLANKLFADHQINVASPEEDWFARPVGRFNPARRPSAGQDEEDVLGGQFNTPATSVVGSAADGHDDDDEDDDDAKADEDEEGVSSGEDTPEDGDSEVYY